jgi:hypothetical protein
MQHHERTPTAARGRKECTVATFLTLAAVRARIGPATTAWMVAMHRSFDYGSQAVPRQSASDDGKRREACNEGNAEPTIHCWVVFGWVVSAKNKIDLQPHTDGGLTGLDSAVTDLTDRM